MRSSITVNVSGDHETSSRNGEFSFRTKGDFTAQVNYHPVTMEEHDTLVVLLTDAEPGRYEQTKWTSGVIAPGIVATVFAPSGVAVEH